MHPINKKYLLLLYSLLLVALFLVVVDHLFLDQWFRQTWGLQNPESWFFWSLVFGLPHVITSLVVQADKDYIGYYGHRYCRTFLYATGLVLFVYGMSVGVGGFLGEKIDFLFKLFFVVYNAQHTLSQQIGLSRIFTKIQPVLYRYWHRLSVGSFTLLLAFMVISKANIFEHLLDIRIIEGCILLLFFISVIFVLKITASIQSRIAIYYVWANVLLVGLMPVFLFMGYEFFVFVIPSAIHTLTAFHIYAVHDHNKMKFNPKNYIYRSLQFLPISLFVLSPLLGLIIAYFFRFLIPIATEIFIVITLVHFHIESFVWKRGSLLRKMIV